MTKVLATQVFRGRIVKNVMGEKKWCVFKDDAQLYACFSPCVAQVCGQDPKVWLIPLSIKEDTEFYVQRAYTLCTESSRFDNWLSS